MSAQEQNRKRRREEKGKATVGQLTSGIKNKQVRSEQYGKLRHKAKVRVFCLSIRPTLSCLTVTSCLSHMRSPDNNSSIGASSVWP